MTVSGTSGNSAAKPVRSTQPSQSPQRSATAPQPDDVRAMSEAMARARGKPLGMGEEAGQRPAAGGTLKRAAPHKGEGRAEGQVGARLLDERTATQRRESERHNDAGFGLLGQGAAPPPLMVPQMPSAQVDPSAFAQMLADLWTRENGRGHKEVRVRFGSNAWPVTGARLVRSADGLLDVTLDVAAAGSDLATDALAASLTNAGVTLGRLETVTAAG